MTKKSSQIFHSGEVSKISQFSFGFMFVAIDTDENHESKLKFNRSFWMAMPALCALSFLQIIPIWQLIVFDFKFELSCFAPAPVCDPWTAFSKIIAIGLYYQIIY